MYKVVVAGSRSFNDYDLLKRKMDFYLSDRIDRDREFFNIEIVSGTARGADSLGERYARERGFALKEFPANWNLYGKRAGMIRNKEMRDYADAVVVFWDGKSRGSKNMIELAVEEKLPVRIVRF